MKFEGVVFDEESFDDKDTCSIVPMKNGDVEIFGNVVLVMGKDRTCGFSHKSPISSSLPRTGDRVKISIKVES